MIVPGLMPRRSTARRAKARSMHGDERSERGARFFTAHAPKVARAPPAGVAARPALCVRNSRLPPAERASGRAHAHAQSAQGVQRSTSERPRCSPPVGRAARLGGPAAASAGVAPPSCPRSSARAPLARLLASLRGIKRNRRSGAGNGAVCAVSACSLSLAAPTPRRSFAPLRRLRAAAGAAALGAACRRSPPASASRVAAAARRWCFGGLRSSSPFGRRPFAALGGRRCGRRRHRRLCGSVVLRVARSAAAGFRSARFCSGSPVPPASRGVPPLAAQGQAPPPPAWVAAANIKTPRRGAPGGAAASPPLFFSPRVAFGRRSAPPFRRLSAAAGVAVWVSVSVGRCAVLRLLPLSFPVPFPPQG